MKTILLLPFFLALPAFAGTTTTTDYTPAPSPCLLTWFAGGSVGYLIDSEEPMYNLHLGVKPCWNFGSWNMGIFGEIGYTETDEDKWSDDELFDEDIDLEFDVMPITLNLKMERPLTSNMNFYFGAGLGVAKVDLDVEEFSDDDWVFTGQIFAGVTYNMTENFELYGGARWIYLDDADLSDEDFDATLDLSDDFLVEIGGRFNF